MDPDLRRRMFRYYDERAPEYEEAYTRGTGTASIPDPQVFQTEIAALPAIVRRLAGGRALDLGCGTGYWLPHYADRCSAITLVDQSEAMLTESRRKVDALGVADRTSFVQGDVLEYEFERHTCTFALAGFLLSHLTEQQERVLFDVLQSTLAPAGRFLVLDSAWSEERARVNARIERQQRRLNDGTPFEIYKRYCDRADVAAWEATYGVSVEVEYFGRAFFAVSGSFTPRT